MATFQLFSSFDMTHPRGMPADAVRGDVTQNSATGFTVAYNLASGSWVTTVTGSGFTYGQLNGQLAVLGGTITSEVASSGGQNVFSLTGASVNVATDGGLLSGSSELNLWLSGGGQITGSSGNDSLIDYSGNHTITGGGGVDRVIFSGVHANYTVTPTANGFTVRDNVGSGGTDTLVGISYLMFADGYSPSANQTINGTTGNDTLTGAYGDDIINGGGGSDTAVFSGASGNYRITQTATGYTVFDNNGVDGNDTLTGISFLRFTDQTISFVGQSITTASLNATLSGGYGNDTIRGAGGHDVVVFTGPSANYTISGDTTSHVVKDNVGLDGTDTLYNVSALQFTDRSVFLPYVLVGTAGADTLTGGYGNDTINGGGGVDTVVFSGNLSGYTIAQTGTGYTVTDSDNIDGSDTLTGIATLRFADQSISLVGQTINGTAGNNTLAGGHGDDTIIGGGGIDTVTCTGPRANYTLSGDINGYLLRDNVGLDGADTLYNISALQFSDRVISLDLRVNGGAGDETLRGAGGNDVIDGGAGVNAVLFSGSRVNYAITQTANGYSVRDTTGADGTDTLSNIQSLRFADGIQNLVIAGDAAGVTTPQLNSLVEIYVAYFNRVPEASGLDYWINQFKAGMSLDSIGNSFYGAAVSFSSLTGYSSTMTDTDFVNKIYQNVLGRSSADQAGLDYWLGSLGDGSQTRGSLVNTIIGAAHTYKGDPSFGWVADLLDNKLAVGKYNAVTAGIDYLTPDDAISQGMTVAARVTPTDTSAAISLIGLSSVVPFTG